MSFKPIGFFTSSKYEQLRVKEATTKQQDKRYHSDSNIDNSQSEDDDDDDEQRGSRIDIQGGAFALLADQSDM